MLVLPLLRPRLRPCSLLFCFETRTNPCPDVKLVLGVWASGHWQWQWTTAEKAHLHASFSNWHLAMEANVIISLVEVGNPEFVLENSVSRRFRFVCTTKRRGELDIEETW